MTSSPVIQLSVIRALRHSVGLNAGTALEMASMPVMAVAPAANARSTSSTVTACTMARWRTGTGWNPRPAACTSPATTRAAIAAMKAYVGTANIAPAWRTPRRFPASRITLTPTPIHTVAGCIDGYAEVMAATPEAIETATVMT